MPYITSWERIGEEIGWKKGWQGGWQGCAANLLLRLLQRRFGSLPEWVQTKVSTADSATLEKWSDKIFDTDSIELIFQ